MSLNIRISLPVLAVVAVAAGFWYWHAHPSLVSDTKVDTSVITPERPIVIPTNGGELVVARVTALERFTRNTNETFFGYTLALGTTKSSVQARVTYTYHITMEKRWPVEIEGKTAVVNAPKIEPTLPVAFDTASIEKYTSSGWARFDKNENLEELERSITGQLQARAISPQYDQMVKDASRETVKAFVTTWLLSLRGRGKEPEYRVIVLFPGEAIESRRAANAKSVA